MPLSVRLWFSSDRVQMGEASVAMVSRNGKCLLDSLLGVSALPGCDRHRKPLISTLNPELPGLRLAGQPLIWDFWLWPAAPEYPTLVKIPATG